MSHPVNPYIAGRALTEEKGFFGRQDTLEWVVRELRNPGINALVLYGQRRIGKTSLLLRLQRVLPSDAFCPIYFDLQDQAERPLGHMLADLAGVIAERAGVATPKRSLFDDKGYFFRDTYLPQVYEVLERERRLVFLLDEFDVLSEKAEIGLPKTAAAKSLFPFIRDLLPKEYLRLALIVVTGRRIEDLSLDFISTFKSSLTKEIWVLDKRGTEALVRQAEANGTLNFTDRAVEYILHLTSGHPYLTQLLCQRIWERSYARNPGFPPQINVSEVEATVPDVLETGQHALIWIWDGLSLWEKIYAAALAEIAKEGEDISEDQVMQVLADHAARLRTHEVELAARDLVKRRVLKTSSERGYCFAVELFRRWVQQNRTLNDVKDELDSSVPSAAETYKIGKEAFLQGRWTLAIRYFRDALEMNPQHFAARVNLGEALLQLGQPNQAVVALRQAYELDRQEARLPLTRALVAHSKVLRAAGNNDSALEACKEAFAVSPNEREVHELMGSMSTPPVPKVRFNFFGVQPHRAKSELVPQLITITGPSGAGKSTVLRYLLDCVREDDALRPVMIPKYTTRLPHDNDQGEVCCVKTIPPECDLIYEQYGARYGLELRTIFESIKAGKIPVVILNDVRAVEDVRNFLEGRARAVFVFRQSPTREWFRELAYEKGLRDKQGRIDEWELERRFRKAQTIYRIYIENIHLFDHVIINSGTLQQLKTQVKQIVKGPNPDMNWPLQYNRGNK